MRKFKQWLAEDRGATAIEYGLIAAGIALVIAASVYALGDVMSGFYSEIYDAVFQ